MFIVQLVYILLYMSIPKSYLIFLKSKDVNFYTNEKLI